MRRRTASAPKAPPRTRAWSTRRESSAALTSAGHGTRAAGCSSQSMTAAASGSIAHAWRGALTTRAPPRRCPRLQRAPTSGVCKSSPSASDPARPACAAYAAVETHGLHPPRRSRHRPRPRAPRATTPLRLAPQRADFRVSKSSCNVCNLARPARAAASAHDNGL